MTNENDVPVDDDKLLAEAAAAAAAAAGKYDAVAAAAKKSAGDNGEYLNKDKEKLLSIIDFNQYSSHRYLERS